MYPTFGKEKTDRGSGGRIKVCKLIRATTATRGFNMGGAPSRQQPRSRYQRDPRMKDLVVELKPVNWHKLGIQLEVPLDRLDKIDEDYQSSERKLSEVLRYWLLNNRSPSWDNICEALQRIGGFGRLVRELRMKYCSLKTCREQHTRGIEA